jgi:hypothetical protein
MLAAARSARRLETEVFFHAAQKLRHGDLEEERRPLHHDEAHANVVQPFHPLAHLGHGISVAGVGADHDAALPAFLHGAFDKLPELRAVPIRLLGIGQHLAEPCAR